MQESSLIECDKENDFFNDAELYRDDNVKEEDEKEEELCWGYSMV